MTELLTAAQMRQIEQAAIDAGAVTGLELMERAGRGVVDAVFEVWPELAATSHRAVVLCGPGNNGGDGFVVARLLKEWGWDVDVFLYGDAEKLPPDAETNLKRWAELGEIRLLHAENVFKVARPDIVVDAVFGIGLTRALPDEIAQVLNQGGRAGWAKSHRIKTVAVDCPSGLNLDTGFISFNGSPDDPDFDAWPRTLNFADLTVTFHSPKPGHYLALGPTLCGELRVADIGLDGEAQERVSIGMPPDLERARLVEPIFLGKPLPQRMWPNDQMGRSGLATHKYDRGHIMVFAGGVGRGGAGRMAARAALRVGAGLVTVLCPPAALQENACHLDAIMLRALRDPAALGEVADDRVTGFCLGPGLGVSENTRAMVGAVLARRATARDRRDPVVVLDADALSSFTDCPDTLFEQTYGRTVLTPHLGEFDRLFPDLGQALRQGASKIDVTRQAAERAGCVVLLKGADTVIAERGGGASVHAATYDRAAPWLATAGAGDVLAGMIAGLAGAPLASEVFSMAEVAAWLHVECARSFGPGLIAEDLPEELPKVFRHLGV